MNKPALLVLCVLSVMLCPSGGPNVWAEKTNDKTEAADKQTASRDSAMGLSMVSADNAAVSPTTSDKKTTPFAELVKDAQSIPGLVNLHQKDTKLYAELPDNQLNRDFIVIISIARGIGRNPLFGGMSWGFGNDWIWQFRKVEDRIQIVRRNVRFRAAKGTPQEEAVHLAYTDSVLFSLPIASKTAGGAHVVDLTPVFKSDLPRITSELSGFSFSKEKSSWASVKGFKDNIEIEVAATYASGGKTEFDTVADSRGVTIHVHYSISLLPKTGYASRPADDRVGHFVTVMKDYSKQTGYDRFVRYVNRWDLRKADPAAEVSPPKRPIVFWLEKTVPFKYRKPVREGIEEWNKAFERVGFANAIEVRQQPADADWEPEDINYNTLRWITSSAGFAMGPSRVNPITGQILDSDILFDADFLQRWQEDYDVLTPEKVVDMTGGPLDPRAHRQHLEKLPPHLRDNHAYPCDWSRNMAQQLALGSALLAEGDAAASKDQVEELIMQGLKITVMHEVGHALGLRHNFKASTYLTLEELNDREKTKQTGLAASVMDYLPVNYVPKGQKQGDYFSTTLGPYDYWAIEYAYKPLDSAEELKAIASRCAEAGLDYGTDEDTRSLDPDPLCNRFDLGKDPIRFARQRVALVSEAMPDLAERMTGEGEGYHQARRAFNILLSSHGNAMHFTARFIGGMYVHRDHRGDAGARPPFAVVGRKKQREAMMLLEEEVFGRDSYRYPAQLYGYLAPSFWSHWGTTRKARIDYPIHEVILAWQDRVLAQLLSSSTLGRLVDSELKVPANAEPFTAAELIERLTTAIFSELEGLGKGKFTNRKPAIGSLRRSLQRQYLGRLANLALGNTFAPADCRSLAYVELQALQGRIQQVLSGKAQIDPYSRAHLSETSARISKVLEAQVQLSRP